MVDSMVMAIVVRGVAPVLDFPLGEGVLCACCEMMCEGVKVHMVYYYTSRTGVPRGKLGNLGERGRFGRGVWRKGGVGRKEWVILNGDD